MSEVDLSTELYSVMVEEGRHGLCRFGMFDIEMVMGNVCFGEISRYPSYFNGPGGMYGMSPAVPLIGRRDKKTEKRRSGIHRYRMWG
ncbi:hypothetical protein [Methanosarcina barkeri]|uniref:hypothetical protein n=1 Tax=Methanosarcina barkeri TaxID=2208 RepID=UPI000AD0DCD5|nr:hypothetical protein [Methanosarcina barkeri]